MPTLGTNLAGLRVEQLSTTETTTTKVLKPDGSGGVQWGAGGGGGGGDVSGPGVAVTDNALARWHTTSGTDIQNSGVIVSDTDAVSGITELTLPNTALHLLDTNASHDLIIAPGSDLTADRTLTLTTGDADRTLTISGSTTLGGGSHSGTNTGDQTITLTGDVTGSGTGSFAATIANDAVTYAKMQDVSATDKLLGRSTAGAGIVEEIACTAAGRALLDDATAADQRTTLGLGTLATQSGTFSGTSSGTNTGDQTITLTGDVTGSGTGSFAATIANDAVTYAKIQDVTATDRLLGRDSAAAGVIEELTVGGGVEFTGSGGIQRSALTGDVTASAGSGSTTIANDAVTNAKMADMAQSTIKGRAAGAGTGDPTDLTAAQATAILDNVVGDSGAGGTKGLVPAPGAGDAAANKFLKADGTWTAPSGSGDVVGPASSTDNAIVRFDGTTGKLIQNSGITIADGATGTLSGTNTGDQNDHGLMTGLSDDDHTQYALLAGRAGGQTLKGGTASGEHLTLESTNHATKGDVKLASGVDLDCNTRDVINIRTATAGNASSQTTGSSTLTIDLSAAQFHLITLAHNITTVTFSNAPVGACWITLEFVQDATGGRTVTGWPTIKWIRATQPTFGDAASKRRIISLYYNGPTGATYSGNYDDGAYG